MKKIVRFLVVPAMLVASTFVSACGTPFIGIRAMEDGSYMITRTQRGAFRNRGIVERCVPNAEQMMCQLIDRW